MKVIKENCVTKIDIYVYGGFLRSPTLRHASKWEKGTRERTDLNQTGSQNDTSNVRKYYIITYSIQKSNISIYSRPLIPGDGFDVIVTTPGVGMVTGPVLPFPHVLICRDVEDQRKPYYGHMRVTLCHEYIII
jgi:hypothetical protein